MSFFFEIVTNRNKTFSYPDTLNFLFGIWQVPFQQFFLMLFCLQLQRMLQFWSDLQEFRNVFSLPSQGALLTFSNSIVWCSRRKLTTLMWIPIKAVQSIKLVIQSCRELKTNSAVSESIHELNFRKKIPQNQPMAKA